MKYKLTIIKYEENKDYETEMAKWEEDGKYRKRKPVKCSLEVFLTEEEG